MTTDQNEKEFDPTAALSQIRRTARWIQNRGATEEWAMTLANNVTDLDDYIDAGGAMPDQWRNIRRGRPRAKEDGVVLDYVTHGTRSGYNRGCHCQACRRANREHASRLNAERRETT